MIDFIDFDEAVPSVVDVWLDELADRVAPGWPPLLWPFQSGDSTPQTSRRHFLLLAASAGAGSLGLVGRRSHVERLTGSMVKQRLRAALFEVRSTNRHFHAVNCHEALHGNSFAAVSAAVRCLSDVEQAVKALAAATAGPLSTADGAVVLVSGRSARIAGDGAVQAFRALAALDSAQFIVHGGYVCPKGEVPSVCLLVPIQ